MSESLFQITCPSCESVFAVTDPELIGQIIACPKCGGMMLVEAPKTAKDAEVALNSEGASNVDNDEVARNGESFPNAEPTPVGENAQDERVGENLRSEENGENEENSGKNNAAVERSRSGRLVASGIALALVGALAFGGWRVFNNGASSVSENNVETGNGENGEIEKSEKGALNEAEDEVGGFAPFAVEERTGEKEGETEFGAANDSTAFQDGENASFGEVDENAQDVSVATKGESEEIPLEPENKENDDLKQSGVSEGNDGNKEDAENSENSAIETNGKNASSATTFAGENAPSIDDSDGDLSGWGELGDLDEDAALAVEENDELDASANGDDEATGEENGEKLAGSNAATGFNEADFERANQNDELENADESAEVDWSGVASTTNPTLQGALPSLRREKKEIDVDARLALPIKSIEFPTSPVAALRILSEFTGVSIVPDLETFVLTRSGMNATLDLTLHDVTAGEALEKIVELLNWEVCREKERILIRPSGFNPDALVEERFDVADLTKPIGKENAPVSLEKFEVSNNLTAETLVALICSTVAPETWKENGGRATLQIDGSTLIVCQNAQNREKTRVLLECLRAARALGSRIDATPERIIPEKLGWESLTKKMTFAPITPPALQNAVEIIENAQKLQIFWDDAALNEAGVGRGATTAARVEGGTVDVLLSEVLEPLNANYLILGEKLIFITDAATAENYQTIEIFSIIDGKGEKPTLEEARALIAEMKQAIAPGSWKETVGDDRQNEGDAVNNAEREEGKNVARNETTLNEEEDETSLLEEQNEIEEIEEIGEEGKEGVNERISENNETGEVALLDGETSDAKKAVVWLDVESACLIIRQSQPNQRALRRWLNVRLAKPAVDKKNSAQVEKEE